jgi:nitronate monooxygenase
LKSFNIGDFNIPVPIIQGGMGVGISLSGLASAVANMGGVGVISTVGIGLIHNNMVAGFRQRSIESLTTEIRKARSLTNGILGVNIMTVITNFSDMVKTSIDEGIDMIFSGAGLPLDLPKYIEGKKSHTKLVPIVSSARAASIISNKWKQHYDYLPDAIVVEGPKAGGHLGFKAEEIFSEDHTLQVLVSEVLKVTKELKERYGKDIPVIAAGGIYTGADIYEFIKLGASAVQIGTRFIATKECDASDEFKNAIVSGGEDDIRIIKSPVGMPGRALTNKFLDEALEGKRKPPKCIYHCIKTCDPETTPFCIANALLAACRGDMSDGFAFTGSNVARIHNITTVSAIFQELQEEFNQAQTNATFNNIKTNNT